MLADAKRQNLLLLSNLLDYFLEDNEEEIERSLDEDGRVFVQSKLEEFSYDAKFELLVISNLDMDVSVKVDYVSGGHTGKSYDFTIRKRGNTFVPMLKDSTDEGRPLVFSIDALVMQFELHQQFSFSKLLKNLKTKKEELIVHERYASDAEHVIEQSYVNYCLDNRRFDLLKGHLENK